MTKWPWCDPDSTALLNSLQPLLPFKVVPLRDSGPVQAVCLYFYSIVHPQVFYALRSGLFRHCLILSLAAGSPLSMQIKNYNFRYFFNEKRHKNKRLALQAVTTQKHTDLSFSAGITCSNLMYGWSLTKVKDEMVNRMRNSNFSVRVQNGSPSKTRTTYKLLKIRPVWTFIILLPLFSARAFTAPSPTNYFHRHCFPSMPF